MDSYTVPVGRRDEMQEHREIGILGYRVCNESVRSVAVAVCDALGESGPQSIVFLNPHSVEVAARDADFRQSITSSTTILCDGVGLSLASIILNRRRVHRIYGYQFFVELSAELSRRRQGRVFFLGGSEDLLAVLVQRYQRDFPGVPDVSCYSPPFSKSFDNAELANMATRIRDFQADILWIGLGSPKQEKVLHFLLPICGAKCGVAVGAVFDFYTDRVAYAPEVVRRLGLQWVHRLAVEPRRLWRRTFVSAPLFLLRVMRACLSGAGPHG